MREREREEGYVIHLVTNKGGFHDELNYAKIKKT